MQATVRPPARRRRSSAAFTIVVVLVMVLCALGMGDPRIWDALNFAWTMVWDMMEIVEAREQQRQSSISSA